ncbi:MAG: HIT family protein [Bacteroidales bacterium]|nr:HIT family protein [Bacteroidales bacterium]
MASIFSKIVAGEIPAYKVAENDEFLAFLDINPMAMGHTLVIPKQEIPYIFEVDDDLLGRLMVFAKRVAKAVEASVTCARIGVGVVGLEVPHCHIHLIPLQNSVGEMNFGGPKLSPSQEELAAMAQKIQSNFK